ncbi:MAG: hypothetical protein ACUVV0_09780 [Anaerolineae bacterium]
MRVLEEYKLASIEECFARAREQGQHVYDQPEQARLREQLPRLLKAIFTSEEFNAKLTPQEKIAFYDDYTRGIATLILTGDCQPLFSDTEEWYESLEELADYEKFKTAESQSFPRRVRLEEA